MIAARAALPGLWGVPASFRARPAWPVPGAVPLAWRRDAAPAVVLADGRRALARWPGEADLMRLEAFLEGLSLDARYHRFHAPVRRFSPAWLRRMVTVDERQLVLVAEAPADLHDAPRRHDGDAPLVAEARWVRDDGRDDRAEFALVVADAWQRVGLGRHLLARLMHEARQHGVRQLHGDVLHDNAAMAALLRRVGGRFEASADARVRRAVIDLAPRGA